MVHNTACLVLNLCVAAAKILAIKAGTFNDQAHCHVAHPTLFCAHYYHSCSTGCFFMLLCIKKSTSLSYLWIEQNSVKCVIIKIQV